MVIEKDDSLPKVGGFQSGWEHRTIPREGAKYPDYLICDHGCTEVVQLISKVSGEPEFELCPVEALRMATTLVRGVADTFPTWGGMMNALLNRDVREMEKALRVIEGLKGAK